MFGMLFDTGFGTRCLVGMRHIADVILRVAGLVVRMLLVCWGARGSFCVRSLVRGRRGFGFADRLNRVRCMDFAAFVVGMRAFVVRIMIVFVRWLLITRLVMVVGSAEVRLGIGALGWGVVVEMLVRPFRAAASCDGANDADWTDFHFLPRPRDERVRRLRSAPDGRRPGSDNSPDEFR